MHKRQLKVKTKLASFLPQTETRLTTESAPLRNLQTGTTNSLIRLIAVFVNQSLSLIQARAKKPIASRPSFKTNPFRMNFYADTTRSIPNSGRFLQGQQFFGNKRTGFENIAQTVLMLRFGHLLNASTSQKKGIVVRFVVFSCGLEQRFRCTQSIMTASLEAGILELCQ